MQNPLTTQYQPCGRMRKRRISQCRCSCQSCENCECTDMSDSKDHVFAAQTPKRQAEVVGRHDRPCQRHRIACRLHSKRQDNTQQTVAGHEGRSASQKGFHRDKNLAHVLSHWQDKNPFAKEMQRATGLSPWLQSLLRESQYPCPHWISLMRARGEPCRVGVSSRTGNKEMGTRNSERPIYFVRVFASN